MRLRVLILLLGALLAAAASHAADKKARVLDRFWTAPDIAAFGVASIVLLPVATYDDNLEARRLVEGTLAQSLRATGYRWVSPASARDLLQRVGGDSLASAVRTMLQKDPRLDSLQAPALSRALRARALLGVRVENWDRVALEANQAGRPYTTVRLSAALVDSTGRVLWTASGSETLEGQYRDPSAGVVGMKSSGLTDQPLNNTAGAPAFLEVLNKLLARWTPAFPARASVAAADSTR